MKLKIFNLLTLAVLGLLAPSASAFSSNNIELQTSIREVHPLKGDIRNNRRADREWIQNQRLVQADKAVENVKSFSVAVDPKTSQYSQPNLVRQTDQSTSFLVGIFMTFVIIGFILGCFLQYRQYKKERVNRTDEILLEIETLEKIRLLEIENLQRIEKMKPEIDQTIIPQRDKQIEALERIWKMKP